MKINDLRNEIYQHPKYPIICSKIIAGEWAETFKLSSEILEEFVMREAIRFHDSGIIQKAIRQMGCEMPYYVNKNDGLTFLEFCQKITAEQQHGNDQKKVQGLVLKLCALKESQFFNTLQKEKTDL